MWFAATPVVAIFVALIFFQFFRNTGSSPVKDNISAQDTTPGHWFPARADVNGAPLSEEQKKQLEIVGAIPYLSGSQPAPAREGVTIYDKENAFNGLNLSTSGHEPEAILKDMAGNVLHTWKFDYSEIRPHQPLTGLMTQAFWRRIHLFENGDLLAIFSSIGLLKIDKNSRQVWYNPCQPHHDLDVAEDGRIFVLTRRLIDHPFIKSDRTDKRILEDFVTILDTDGKELQRISLLQCFLNSNYAPSIYVLKYIKRADIFHTNTLHILDGSLATKIPAFKKGNVLICSPYLRCIAVVDLKEAQVVWALFNMWGGQHDPVVLDNNNILVFDNYGFNSKSQVEEFDPVTQMVHWVYKGDSRGSFYSKTCSTAQRLPNGNTLIRETEAGRAFEVTGEGSIVWEYLNPHRAGSKNELIAALLEVKRLPSDFPEFW